MKVALLNIRFEISVKSEIKPDIEYTAKGFSLPQVTCLSKGSYASVVQEDGVPPTPDESRELTIADYRGCRKLLDIEVVTYNSEDFDFEELDKYLSVYPMSTNDKDTAAGGHVTCQETTTDKKPSAVENISDLEDVKFYSVNEDIDTQSVVRPKSQSPTPRASSALHFYSGNPSVEKVKGILHIYKDNVFTNMSDDAERSELICMLAVPARYTIHDLLKFNGPCIQGIEYMRIIRDGSQNQYMALVKFRTKKFADEYYKTYNNTAFNSIESDVCHLVYVGRVEMLKESENACIPVPGMTELPNCPVCLERMDESVDGILTILCNHAFHMECLDKWGDTSCPVCRYCQTPEDEVDNHCMTCGSQESLWICLICGNIGCGRYVGLHAFRHFQETQHTYAMELGNNKVWDYVGDNYVHRLVQNKSDGKLVQVDEGGNPVQHEKLDALNLEYTYLLTNQLESQRLYFQDKMDQIEEDLLSKIHVVKEENSIVTTKCHVLQTALEQSYKEKQLTEKKCAQLHTRLKKALRDLQEESHMNDCLRKNQEELKLQVSSLEAHMKGFTTEKDQEVNELREQLRDVMFYVEAQQKLQETEGVSQSEIQDGQVIVGAAATSSPHNRKTRKKPR